jgi:hypothetical protein
MPTQNEVIAIFVTVLLAAILLPVAFNQIFNANTTGWDANTVTIFSLIPIIAGVAVILGLVSYYRHRGE